jgi:hypothetical protein
VVSACRSANPASPTATCGAGSGWISFIDTNADCTRAAGEEIVASAVIATDVNATTNGTCLSFATTGFKRVVGGQPNTHRLLFCDSRRNVARFSGTDVSTARGVEILPTGRPAVAKSVAELASWSGGANPVSCL